MTRNEGLTVDQVAECKICFPLLQNIHLCRWYINLPWLGSLKLLNLWVKETISTWPLEQLWNWTRSMKHRCSLSPETSRSTHLHHRWHTRQSGSRLGLDPTIFKWVTDIFITKEQFYMWSQFNSYVVRLFLQRWGRKVNGQFHINTLKGPRDPELD